MSKYADVIEAKKQREKLSPAEFEKWLRSIYDKQFERVYISPKDRYTLLKKYDWQCAICKQNLQLSKKKSFGFETAQIDHIHPISLWFSYKGEGINESENLQPLCPSCNRKKSNKVLE